MANRIITISREFGSGGRYIAEKLSEKTGLVFYDKDIIGKVVEKTGYSEKYIEKHGEYANTKSIFSYAFSPRFNDGSSIEDIMLEAQRKVILELADRESCIIVGRSADYILKERENVLHVFIEGNMTEKVARIKEIYGKDESQAITLINEMDKKRAINYQYVTGLKWGDRKNYDVILNTSVIGYDKSIDIIASLI